MIWLTATALFVMVHPMDLRDTDLNGDQKIDGADLGILLGGWGTPNADLDGDGTTDGVDLGLLIGRWESYVPAWNDAIYEGWTDEGRDYWLILQPGTLYAEITFGSLSHLEYMDQETGELSGQFALPYCTVRIEYEPSSRKVETIGIGTPQGVQTSAASWIYLPDGINKATLAPVRWRWEQ